MHWKNNPPTGVIYSEAKLWFTPATQGRRWKRLPAISAPQAYPSWIGKKLGLWARWEGGSHNPPPFGLRAEPANTGTPPLPVGCSHIHSKIACRGASEPRWRSAAPVSAPASAGAGRFPLGSGTRGSRRDQVLLSLPQNRRKHGFSPVSFLHVLHGYVVRVGLKSGFSHLVLSVPNRSQPFPSPPPPKTHPASPFRALPGALRSFYPLLIREIRRIFALSLALEMIQDSVEHLNSGFRSRGGNRGKLRFFCFPPLRLCWK